MSDEQTVTAMPSALQQAGIGDRKSTSDTLSLEEMDGAIIVRAHSFPDSVPDQLPATTGEVTSGDPSALCIRPNEWLFVSDSGSARELLERVRGEFDLQSTTVNNQTDSLAVFRLSGEGAAWLLSKLSGLDFLAGTAAGPHCACTRMGKVAVVIHYHPVENNEFVFDLIFDRSIAKYLWELLAASAPHADDLAVAFGAASSASCTGEKREH